MRVRLKLIQR